MREVQGPSLASKVGILGRFFFQLLNVSPVLIFYQIHIFLLAICITYSAAECDLWALRQKHKYAELKMTDWWLLCGTAD